MSPVHTRGHCHSLRRTGATLYRVKKTSIYLDPVLDRQVGEIARDEGVTKAELIRRSLAQMVATKRPQARLTIATFSGDGPNDVSDRVDEYLEATGFGT